MPENIFWFLSGIALPMCIISGKFIKQKSDEKKENADFKAYLKTRAQADGKDVKDSTLKDVAEILGWFLFEALVVFVCVGVFGGYLLRY